MEINKEYMRELDNYIKGIVDVRKGTGKRVSWDYYFIMQATMTATRATCLRRGFGAVIIDSIDHSIVGSGYCGNAAGTTNCIDLKKCFREDAKIPSGMLYGLCQSIHAEENAIADAGKKQCKGKTIYVSGIDFTTGKLFYGKPCYKCESRIINAGLEKIVYMDNNYGIITMDVKGLAEWRKEHPFEESEKELNLLKQKGFQI